MIYALQVRFNVILNWLRTSRFSRDVASVGFGIAAAQAISLAFAPFLTRLYGPEAFGVLGAFTAVVTIISPLATLCYSSAIVLPKEDDDAFAIIRLSLLVSLVVSVLTLVFIHIFIDQLAGWTNLESNQGFLYLIPLSLLLSAFYSVASQKAIRLGLFKTNARSYVESTFIINTLKLVAGLLSPSGLVLISIYVLSSGINALVLISGLVKHSAIELRQWFGYKGLSKVASEYKDFPIYRMPQSVINAASLGMPVLLLASYFGMESAGQYSLAVLVLGAPVMLLGQSFGDVLFRKIARSFHDNKKYSSHLIAKSTWVLFLLALIPFGTVFTFGPEIFLFLFGKQWYLSGEYAKWLSLWMAMVLISRPSVSSMTVLGMNKYLLINEVIATCLRVTAIMIGVHLFKNDRIAIILFSLVGVFTNISMLCAVKIRMYKFQKIEAGNE